MGTGAGVSAVSMRRQGRRKTLEPFKGSGSTDLDVEHRQYVVNLDVTVAMAASMPMIFFPGGARRVFDMGLSGMSISTLHDLSGQVRFVLFFSFLHAAL